jgi:hypothetical protein
MKTCIKGKLRLVQYPITYKIEKMGDFVVGVIELRFFAIGGSATQSNY